MQNLFVNGCSFNGPRKKWGKECNTWVGKEIADHYGVTLYDFARGGRGNRRICDTTKIFFEQNLERKKDTFALIQWTSPGRRDYPTNDGYKKHKFPTMETTWKTWDPNRDSNTTSFIKYLFGLGADLDQMTQVESILGLLDLQDYFQNKGYPYVFYNTLSDAKITNPDVQLLFDKIDKKRFFKPETSHLDYTVANGQQCKQDDPHPNEEGHKDWAKQLKEFIDANNLRSI